MAKTIFEEMGGAYVQQGDYLLPVCPYPPKKKISPLEYGDSGICAI